MSRNSKNQLDDDWDDEPEGDADFSSSLDDSLDAAVISVDKSGHKMAWRRIDDIREQRLLRDQLADFDEYLR